MGASPGQSLCPSCAEPVEGGTPFCPACGFAFLAPDPGGRRLCESCDTDNAPGARFCEGCGESLDTVPTAAAERAAASSVQPLARAAASPWRFALAGGGSVVAVAAIAAGILQQCDDSGGSVPAAITVQTPAETAPSGASPGSHASGAATASGGSVTPANGSASPSRAPAGTATSSASASAGAESTKAPATSATVPPATSPNTAPTATSVPPSPTATAVPPSPTAAPPAVPALRSVLVAGSRLEPSLKPGDVYDTATVQVQVDPARAIWIAWNNAPTVSLERPERPGVTLLGPGGFGTNDRIELTVTSPDGKSLTAALDQNDAWGRSSGPQNVIFGTAAAAPDAFRISPAFATPPNEPAFFNEGGTHNSVFTVAGTYTFTFVFVNSYSNSGGHNAVYLLIYENP